MKKFERRLVSILFIFKLATYVGCVTDDDGTESDPAVAFEKARSYYDDGAYDLAVQKLGEFKSRYPYSKHSTLAELYVANSHFELGNYESAALDYKQFIKLHPKHEKVPFAMYRVGESYWVDAPEEIDRDQELTRTALKEWGELVEKFPLSQYTKVAKEKMSEGRRRIADSHEFIIKFYCKQKLYHACAFEAIKVLEDFTEFKDIRESALKLVIVSFKEMAQSKSLEPDKDSDIFHKRMTSEQMLAKAATFEKLLSKTP